MGAQSGGFGVEAGDRVDGERSAFQRLALSLVEGGEQEDEGGVPVDGDLVHGVGALVVDPHAHGWAGWELAGDLVSGAGVGAAGEEAGPGLEDVIGGAGPVVRVHEGAGAEVSDPGDAVAVAADEVAEVVAGGVEGGLRGCESVRDEEEERVVGGDGV